MKRAIALGICLALAGCHVLSAAGGEVVVVDRAADACARIGHVNVDLTWTELPSEQLVALRNKTADMGGNTLVLVASDSGIAYHCPVPAG